MKWFTRVLLLGLVALALVGCGGGSSKKDTAAASSPNGAAFQKYTACLAKHGVKLQIPSGAGSPPAGGTPGGTVPSRPPGGSFPSSGAPPNGATFPAGGPAGGTFPSGGGPNGSIPSGGSFGLDQSDPKTKAALNACASLQPTFQAP